jgi:hypothetical protein
VVKTQWLKRSGANCALSAVLVSPSVIGSAQTPDVSTIIQKSVAATQEDFKFAPQYNHKEQDRTSEGSKTYQVTMIEGTPYQRLIAVNGKPLSPAQDEQEKKKQEQAATERRSESSQQRKERIAKYEKDRRRNHEMMEQLTRAFNFKLLGQRKARGFTVYVLKATPRPGYQPPNLETQVLPGMQGELWIDAKTYQWVKVTARVIHPVSIEGFLAQVEPGTQFELEKSPVDDHVWQVSHFSMKSQAKVLYLFNHASWEDDTYFDYQRLAEPVQSSVPLSAK